MQILITNYTGHQPHLGCIATCDALETLLRERYPNATIEKEKHSVKRADALMYLGKWGLNRRGALMKNDARWADFQRADLIVVNAEGTLHAKNYLKSGAGSNQRLVEAYLATRDLKKDVMMVNHSISSRHKNFDDLVRAAYPKMHHVAVREPFSREYLQGLGVTNAVQSADAIFSMTPPPPASESPLRGKFLITDSFSWKVGWQQRRGRVRELIEHIKKQGLEVAYLSVLSQPFDKHFADSLELEYHAFDDYTAFMAHLQTAHFVLTGRFHTAVFAAFCAVPFLGFEAPTYKVEGLCRLLDHPIAPLHLFRDAPAETTAKVERALSERAILQAHLSAKQPFMRDLARQNVPFQN